MHVCITFGENVFTINGISSIKMIGAKRKEGEVARFPILSFDHFALFSYNLEGGVWLAHGQVHATSNISKSMYLLQNLHVTLS